MPLPGDAVHALKARKSARVWKPEPLKGTLLSRALRYAAEQDTAMWAPAFREIPSPTAAVLAQRIQGLPEGYYHYTLGHGEFLAQPQILPRMEELVLQLEFGQAPVIILILGDMSAALSSHGPVGHRHLLTRSAAYAHAIWLSALSDGAAGTVFAGVIGSAARTTLGIDGFRQAQMLGVALGYAQDPSRSTDGAVQ
ncbi:nitroreductase family protein [Streptomyces sp. NPDC019539]|uniref:nitroreductase family protein n=1 Tax=Streptomyces sp. NPDC019539 TaxID=3365063 RepID=UPI0037A2F564